METVAGRSCGPDYPRHLFKVQQVDLATGTAKVAHGRLRMLGPLLNLEVGLLILAWW